MNAAFYAFSAHANYNLHEHLNYFIMVLNEKNQEATTAKQNVYDFLELMTTIKFSFAKENFTDAIFIELASLAKLYHG